MAHLIAASQKLRIVMNLPPLIDSIARLIAAPSISCTDPALDQSNLPVIHELAEWCTHLGFKTEILPIAGETNKANLIATYGEGDQGLVLAGHTDTVPYDAQGWLSDPLQLVQREDRLYGLGVADMKGFLALALHAVEPLLSQRFDQPLILLATADEETTMSGAKALLSDPVLKARHAVIGEPTGLRPVHVHKGIMMEAIHIQGLSGHSSDPRFGNSALEGMVRVMNDLMVWRDQLQQRYHNDLFEVPVPTLNLGHIHGGDNPNRICGECHLQIDLRPLPGMSLLELRHLLQQRVAACLENSGLQFQIESLFDGVEAMATPAQAQIVRSIGELTEFEPQSVAFATEGPFLNALGMETVIWGPGDIAQAHQINEYVELSRLQPTIQVLSQLIQRFCIKSD